MQRNKFLKTLSLLLLSSFFVGCSTLKDKVVLKTEYVKPSIDIQPRPDSLDLHDIEFYAVSEKNLEDFIIRFKNENGDLVFFAISVVDYENMALNLSHMRRYILQQKSLIEYYENSIKAIDTPEPIEEVVQRGTFSSIFQKED